MTKLRLQMTKLGLLCCYCALPTVPYLNILAHYSRSGALLVSRTTHYCYILLLAHYSLLTTYYSLLTTHYVLLTAPCSLLTVCYLLLLAHYSLRATYCSLLTSWSYLLQSGLAGGYELRGTDCQHLVESE